MALYPKAYFEALRRKGRANAIISVAVAEYIPRYELDIARELWKVQRYIGGEAI